MPNDYGDLRYDQAAIKASHNSHDQVVSPDELPSLLDDRGCRALELDISGATGWSVSHDPGYQPSPKRPQLWQYLRSLAQWSASNDRHDPVTVHLDLKAWDGPDRPSTFARALDDALDANLGRERIFTPGDLLAFGGGATLREAAARKGGWPTLRGAELTSKFILVITADYRNEYWKDEYAKFGLAERLCFSDVALEEVHPDPTNASPNRVFFNVAWNPNSITVNAVFWLRDQPGLVSRAYPLNKKGRWREAREHGVNLLATDKLGEAWATVGPEPFGSDHDEWPR